MPVVGLDVELGDYNYRDDCDLRVSACNWNV